MNRQIFVRSILLTAAIAAVGCAGAPSGQGWETLIDGGKGLENWTQLGDANWRSEGGTIMADRGAAGFLVSKNSYKDFAIYAEFWAETDTNSGIFLRLSDPKKIGSDNSYEVNIWDIRPDPTFGTGAIVDFAPVPVPIANKAGGRWNTFEITAKGNDLTVKLNGVITARTQNTLFAAGPFALQFGPGVKGVTGGPIKWRKVQIKAL